MDMTAAVGVLMMVVLLDAPRVLTVVALGRNEGGGKIGEGWRVVVVW